MRAGLLRIAIVAALIGGTAAEAHWLRAKPPHFILYNDGSERSLRGYAAVVKDYGALLHSLFGVGAQSSPNRLPIYRVGDARELRRFSQLGTNVLGSYRADTGGIATFATRSNDGYDGLSGQQVRAHRLDDNQFQSLYRYGETFAIDSAKSAENTVNVMILAHNLAPQISEISVNTARLLLAREQDAGARALLEPVAANPHGGDIADEARKLLDQLATRLPVATAGPELVPTVPAGAVK